MIRGRAWKLGDDVTTDHIIPGRLKYKVRTLEDMKKYVFHDLIPGFSDNVREGDVIIAGKNFGYGSSREHAARLLRLVGIGAVVAKSFARIFYRNAINVGLPVIDAGIEAKDGDSIEIDLERGIIKNLTNNFEVSFPPYPKFIMKIIQEGGVESYYKRWKKFPWE